MRSSDSAELEAVGTIPDQRLLVRLREALFSPTRKHYAYTFLTEYSVLLSQLLVYRLAASLWGPDGFSEYALSRRTISLIQPVLLLGLGVALPRYIAISHADPRRNPAPSYFAGALFCIGFATAAVVLVLNLFRESFAFLFFGAAGFSHLVGPLSLMLVGLSLHSLCYAYFQGVLKIGNANRLQIVNTGVVPLVVLIFFSKTVGTALVALGLFWIAVSALAMTFIPLRQRAGDLIPPVKELLRYGLPRVPGDFIFMALFALPAIFVAHTAGVREAGYVAFALSGLRMIGSLFSPLGIVLLPQASRMVGQQSLHHWRGRILQILLLSGGLAVLITVAGELFARPLIVAYLGEGFQEMTGVLRIVILCAVPYAVFVCLRSVIDARHVNPLNTINTFIAFGIFLLGAFLARIMHADMVYVLGSFVLGMFVLGAFTIWEVRKIFFPHSLPVGGFH